MGRAPGAPAETADRILDIAERLVQTQGFNGFSYADISKELGITKASLHYHFPTKAALGEKVIERYHEVFQRLLADIDREEPSAKRKLDRYVELYAMVLRAKRLCLCGMLAAEYGTLPEAMRDRVQRFFDANEAWLANVLDRGRTAKKLRFEGTPVAAARMLVGALEGAMLVARSYGDAARFTASASFVIAQLAPKKP